MSQSRRKGTSAETAVVNYLQLRGWPYAERRALHGSNDRGDITGTPGICWEVKAGSRLCIPEWMRQTETERLNDGATLGVLVVKPVGIGTGQVNRWWAITPLDQMTWTMNQAGFGSQPHPVMSTPMA